MPYFRPDEAIMLKATIIQGTAKKTLEELIQETLEERFQRRQKKRVGSGDHRICTAHDIAPIIEKALGIQWRELARDQDFQALRDSSGLHLKDGESWNGLGRKPHASQAPQQHKKKSRR